MDNQYNYYNPNENYHHESTTASHTYQMKIITMKALQLPIHIRSTARIKRSTEVLLWRRELSGWQCCSA